MFENPNIDRDYLEKVTSHQKRGTFDFKSEDFQEIVLSMTFILDSRCFFFDSYFNECNEAGWGEVKMKQYEFVKLREDILEKLAVLGEHEEEMKEMLTPEPLSSDPSTLKMKPFLTTDYGSDKRQPVDGDGICVSLLIAPNYYKELREIFDKIDKLSSNPNISPDDSLIY